MESINFVDRLNCRICLKQCPEAALSANEIKSCYHILTGFNIKTNDAAKKICAKCFSDLNASLNLIENAMRSEVKMAIGENNPQGKHTLDELNQANEELIQAMNSEIKQPIEDALGISIPSEFLDCEPDVDLLMEHTIPNLTPIFSPIDASTPCIPQQQQVSVTASRSSQSQSISSNDNIENGGGHKCMVCKKTFTKPGLLRTHISRVHPKGPPVMCASCGKSFKTRKNLIAHEKTHLDRKVNCSICNKELKPESIRKHMKNVHKIVPNNV